MKPGTTRIMVGLAILCFAAPAVIVYRDTTTGAVTAFGVGVALVAFGIWSQTRSNRK